MRNVGVAMIFIVFLAIFGLLNYYIGLRVWQTAFSKVAFFNGRLYWILFWLIAFSYILARGAERFLPGAVSDYLNLIGGYWMAAMLYFLLILPAADIIKLIYKKFGFIPRDIPGNSFIKTYAGALIVLIVIGILIYGTFNARYLKVANYDININKKLGNVDKLNIVMISDAHLGTIVDNSRLTKIIDKINSLNPDLVLMGGDIVDERVELFDKQNMGENFKRLKSKYGVYAVTGNHEYYGGEVKEIVQRLEASNVKVLNDDYVKVADSFYVVGREDIASESMNKEKRKSLEAILTGADKNLPVILMDHNPRDLKEPQESGIDLQFSGHTHRGQMFPSQIVTSSIYEIDWGYLKKDNFNIIVSSGVGTWGPPVRVGNSAEIVQVNLAAE
jgi:predicted MPP superfamily phosphohydrolase